MRRVYAGVNMAGTNADPLIARIGRFLDCRGSVFYHQRVHV